MPLPRGLVLTKGGRLLSALVVLVLLAGCGRFNREAEPTPLPPTELNLISFDLESSWGWAEQALIEDFKDGQPNVDFRRSSYQEPPTSYLDIAPPPDLMVISPGYLLDAAISDGRLLEVTDVWQQSGLEEHYPPAFRGLSANYGKQYYVPIAYTWIAVYYNQAMFGEFGLQHPTTWAEFIEACEILVSNGIAPISLAGSDVFLSTIWFDYLDLRLNGIDFHRELTNGRVPFQDDRVRTVFEVWSSMLERGYFMDDPERMNEFDSLMAVVDTREGFAPRGRAAMTLTGPSWLGAMQPELQSGLDFFAFPNVDPGVPTAELLTAYGYMIPTSAENREAALAYVRHAASADVQADLGQRLASNNAGLVPANLNAAWDDVPQTEQGGAGLITGAEAVSPFFVLAIPDLMWDPTNRAIRYFLENPWDVENTVLMLEEARQAALDAFSPAE